MPSNLFYLSIHSIVAAAAANASKINLAPQHNNNTQRI